MRGFSCTRTLFLEAMLTVKSIEALRRQVNLWRREGDKIALVPTMGNLHDGHLRLVAEAQKKADRIVVSIFVNPTQFSEGEDYSTYPRTEEDDRSKLSDAHVDLVFMPPVSEIYSPDARTSITVAGLSDIHCGKFREGHFSGVATIVCKLLNMVQPDLALFGKKDYQQLMVIQRMVRDLDIPVQLQGVATFRESDGLAMSSRNDYLTTEQRRVAPQLYKVLSDARDAVLARETDYAKIEQEQIRFLQQAGFIPEFFSICRADDLQPADCDDLELVILAAAKLGKARLIDNIQVVKN